MVLYVSVCLVANNKGLLTPSNSLGAFGAIDQSIQNYWIYLTSHLIVVVSIFLEGIHQLQYVETRAYRAAEGGEVENSNKCTIFLWYFIAFHMIYRMNI